MKKIIITAFAAAALCLSGCVSDQTKNRQDVEKEAGRAVLKAERKVDRAVDAERAIGAGYAASKASTLKAQEELKAAQEHFQAVTGLAPVQQTAP